MIISSIFMLNLFSLLLSSVMKANTCVSTSGNFNATVASRVAILGQLTLGLKACLYIGHCIYQLKCDFISWTVPVMFSEERHCHGHNKVWPVWLPHWHCASRWPEAPETSGRKVTVLDSADQQGADIPVFFGNHFAFFLKLARWRTDHLVFSGAFPSLATWMCCKHPWLEAGVWSVRAFSRMFAASHCLWQPTVTPAMTLVYCM